MIGAISSEDVAGVGIVPVDKGIDSRLLRDYAQLRDGAFGTVVLIEHHSRKEYAKEARPGLSRYRTLLELGRLGIENVFVRLGAMQISNLRDNADREGPRQFIRRYMSEPHNEPSRQELEFFMHNDEEILYHFLWEHARLIPCCTPKEFKHIQYVGKKMGTSEGESKDRVRERYQGAWADAAANAFTRMPVGAAGVHVHSEGYLARILHALDGQERRYAVFHRSFR
jgi:hypothetical protein